MHKLRLKILLGWLTLLPITAYSLGLGDIDVKSFLNQPLQAEISIISARPGEVDDLLVGLANREAFSRASLARPSHLSDLKFKIINREDDSNDTKILITTKSAVKEPVLNFLVEADWSKGKVFREFTILLDPPYIAQQIAQAQQQPAKQEPVKQTPPPVAPKAAVDSSVPEPIVNQQIEATPDLSQSGTIRDEYVDETVMQDEKPVAVEPQAEPEVQPLIVDSDPEPEVAASAAEQTVVVEDGMTLWSLTKSLKPDGVSMSQLMLAIKSANQDAFGLNNINNLKQGSVLRIPSYDQMRTLSQRDAYLEVLEQNGLWDEYLASSSQSGVSGNNTQSEETSTDAPQQVAETAGDQSNLSIVAVDEGASEEAALRSDQENQTVSELSKKLLLSEEEIESLRVEKEDLESRVKALEQELSKRDELKNLVTLEDDSLAQLQQQLEQQEKEEADFIDENEVAVAVEPESPVVNEGELDSAVNEPIVEPTLVEQPQTEEVVTAEADLPAQPELDNTDESPSVVVDEAASEVETAAEVTVEAPVIQAPIIVSEPETSASSLVDDMINAVMSNPIVQGAIAAVLLVILLVVKWLKGRQKKEDDSSDEVAIEDVGAEGQLDTQSGIIIPNVDEDETPINVPQMEKEQPVDDFASTVSSLSNNEADEEDEFSKTAVINPSDISAMQQEAAVEEPEEQDETLDEVDVYLAYSLFDNAEELLKSKLDESPERADYRAKLLDTYFATKNKEAFVTEATILNDLGEPAKKYWSKVQTMGYELDPENAMFADGKGGDLAELAIAKPEAADFDLGAEDVSTENSDFDLSLDGDDTDFDLSEDTGPKEKVDISEGIDLDMSSDDFALDLDADDDTVIRGEEPASEETNELPDELGSLDFEFDEKESEKTAEADLETSSALDNANDDSGLDFEIEIEEDKVEEDTSTFEETSVLDVEKTETVESADLEFDLHEIDGEDEALSEVVESIEESGDDLALDIDDIEEEIDLSSELENAETAEQVEPEAELEIDLDSAPVEDNVLDIEEPSDDLALDVETVSEDLDLDKEIGDFDSTQVLTAADEITGIESVEDDEDNVVLDLGDAETQVDLDQTMAMDLDQTMAMDLAQTDAKDDEPELDIPDLDLDLDMESSNDAENLEDITDINSIEELILPDDVDEVATKLDLAKAFIDMGDSEGAKNSLEDVLVDGNDEQKEEAQQLLKDM